MYEQFFKYKEEVEKDLQFDASNIDEFSIKLPSRKHFWVGRLVEAKIKLKKLENTKAEAIKTVQEKVKTSVGLSQSSYTKIINEQEPIRKIDEQIEEWKIIVEYLEKVEKVFAQSSYDVKNSVEIMKMEIV